MWGGGTLRHLPIRIMRGERCFLVHPERGRSGARRITHLLLQSGREPRGILFLIRAISCLYQWRVLGRCILPLRHLRCRLSHLLLLQQPTSPARQWGDRLPKRISLIRPDVCQSAAYLHQRDALRYIHVRIVHACNRSVVYIQWTGNPSCFFYDCVSNVISFRWSDLRAAATYMH